MTNLITALKKAGETMGKSEEEHQKLVDEATKTNHDLKSTEVYREAYEFLAFIPKYAWQVAKELRTKPQLY
jgi:hypothetical protein